MSQTIDERAELAILIPVLAVGGAERVVAELLTHLPRDRYRLTLMTLAGRPSAFEVPEDVRIEPIRARSFMTALPSILRIVWNRPPDVLCAHMTLPAVWALLARALTRRRFAIVCVEHNTPSEEYSNETARRRLLPLLMRALYPRADRLVAISAQARADLCRVLRRPVATVDVIRNPVLSRRVNALAEQRVEHPWLEDSRLDVVLSVGRLVPQKNHELLLRAFARVRKAVPAARLIIYGEGPLRERLEGIVRDEGLGDDVALPGITRNPYAAMRHAAVFVVSSRYEGSPLTVIEALACGTPVVATDVGDIGETLGRGRYGRLVAAEAHDLAEGILGVIRNERPPAVPREVLEGYTVEAGVAAYDELFRELLEGRPATPRHVDG